MMFSFYSMAPLLVQPSGDMSAKIYKELCEDPSAVPDKMKHVIEWLEMQPHLPPFKGLSQYFNKKILY
jgi:hypothetical protein